ncbi:protein TIFY 10A isoform X1 [Arachis stenosperma]|uniref:protein TIFY 10A isoform X1 n=1 Tax=Arachis stenosperma TaxID=217475 RepID=UPI0025AD0628|nr:protein TIFY 10A isoform X1 [Arachis stenosperma]
MSSSSEYSGVSGQNPVKSPEISTFSQTCNRLSQYLRENGSFGDLTLGITKRNPAPETHGSPENSCYSATTMELFPTKENNNVTTMDLLYPRAPAYANTRYACFLLLFMHRTVSFLRLTKLLMCSALKDGKGAQLTIFYGGEVMVFDDIPAEKAEEILSLAKRGNSCACASTQHTRPYLFQPHSQLQSAPVVGDLPIARKASLHRFLEKRKDRIASKAPYQSSSPVSVPNKAAESSMAWLGLGA